MSLGVLLQLTGLPNFFKFFRFFLGCIPGGGSPIMVLSNLPNNDGVSLWQEEALCQGRDSSVFFTDEQDDETPSNAYKEICNSCPVRSECLEFALIYNMYGIWGGTTDKERNKLPKFNLQVLREDFIESGLYNSELKV